MVYHQKDSLSQNFIKYPRLVIELLDASNISADDLILEIGPGKGIITKELCKRAKSVIAVEKDKKLADELIKSTRDLENLKIINQDFLDYYLPTTPYKVFSNIPFSITAKIVNKFLKSQNMPESMYLIMQKEVAEKFKGIPNETQSSILTKPFYEVEILGDIDRTNFTSKPQVIIDFVQFKKREIPFIKIEDKKDFFDFVIYGFNQWKGTFLDAYKKVFTFAQLDTLKKTYKLNNLKPSEVSFDNWLLVYKTYKRIATEEQKDKILTFPRTH